MIITAEWTKLPSLRSTWWSLLTAAGLTIGIAIIVSEFTIARPPNTPPDPVSLSLTGVQLAQVAVGVLGVLLMTGEYATGTIRTTLTAVPGRLSALWGKTAVAALTVLAVSLPAAVVAFVAGQQILAGDHLDVGLGSAGALRAVVGGALYLTLIGLLGLALGTILRSTAGAVAALFGLLFGLPIVAAFLPAHTAEQVIRYLPDPAGTVILNADPDPGTLGPWTGLALLAGYVVVGLALGAWRLQRSDV
jgi:ABC-2 type transport system permease protein